MRMRLGGRCLCNASLSTMHTMHHAQHAPCTTCTAQMTQQQEVEEDEEYDSPIVRLSPEERSAISEHEKDGQVAVTFSLPYQV